MWTYEIKVKTVNQVGQRWEDLPITDTTEAPDTATASAYARGFIRDDTWEIRLNRQGNSQGHYIPHKKAELGIKKNTQRINGHPTLFRVITVDHYHDLPIFQGAA